MSLLIALALIVAITFFGVNAFFNVAKTFVAIAIFFGMFVTNFVLLVAGAYFTCIGY